MDEQEQKSPWLTSNSGSEFYNQPIFGPKIQGSPFSESHLWIFFLPTQVKEFHVSCTHSCHKANMSQKFMCILEKKIGHIPLKYALNATFCLTIIKFIHWICLDNVLSPAFCCVRWLFWLYLVIIFKCCSSHEVETVLTIVLSMVCFRQSGEICWFISFPHRNLMISL